MAGINQLGPKSAVKTRHGALGGPGSGRQVVAAPTIGGREFAPRKSEKLPKKADGLDYAIRNDGTIAIKSNKLEVDRFYLEHHAEQIQEKHLLVRHYELVGTFTRNKHGLIGLPKHFEHDKFAFNYTGSPNENYISGQALAALLGALRRAGFCDISLNHWSNADGSSPKPSTSHAGGKNGDIRPLNKDHSGNPVNLLINPNDYDKERNQKLVDALRVFGWNSKKSILFYKDPKSGYLPNGTTHFRGHQHHFHVQGFKPKIIRYK